MKITRILILFCLLCILLLQARNSGAQAVTQVSAGKYHTLFLKSDGGLWVMGWNVSGQLGDGTLNQTNQPEQIISSNVATIVAGELHSLFLKTDGGLWGMGANGSGELGLGYYSSHVLTPTQCILATNASLIAKIHCVGVRTWLE